MIDPRFLYVVAVARAGSFTGAADTIGVTQSAITKRVADLERQIGYSIFDRTSRGAFLTEQGRDFVERAARLTEDAAELLRGPRALEDAYTGTLRIGVCPAFITGFIGPPLEMLLSRHPTIRLDVNGATFERIVQQLRDGVIDVAFGYDAAFAVCSDLTRQPLPSCETTLFVRRGHPLLDLLSLTAADLADFDMLSPSDSRPYGTVIRNIYENQGIEWQRRVHIIDHFSIVERIVSSSDAIGCVSSTLGHSPVFQERFETLDSLALFPVYPLCCATRDSWKPTPAVRAFIAACVETMPPP